MPILQQAAALILVVASSAYGQEEDGKCFKVSRKKYILILLQIGKDTLEFFQDTVLSHKPSAELLSPSSLSLLLSASSNESFQRHLDLISVERPVGSEPLRGVEEHIRGTLDGLGWSVEKK